MLSRHRRFCRGTQRTVFSICSAWRQLSAACGVEQRHTPCQPANVSTLTAEQTLRLVAGLKPIDIDYILLTHLHRDHTGWCMVPGGPF